ncbi:hypothetical protein MNEG_13297 [Monoraphidium neglectum]|uniref:Uncharacterized protein n=1 Tax=Monoraphidium neglectum TaxID=145388 RepID=A0A0D2LST2_9CHLO|nr:hypothetical protein MNEG_13297 [Monoraphidium neglectum]KIY94664.1 hypothetical protein MNEG_13297 [Monoraphidium neglectum]|eukprot:XP_013893684.1 hypothetical protein MNEG_13297 [Monoraphidium neglectum]
MHTSAPGPAPGTALASDSRSLAAALRDASVSRVLIAARRLTLDPVDFGLRPRIVISRPVEISACSPEPNRPAARGGGGILDLVGGRSADLAAVAAGGALALSGPAPRGAGAPATPTASYGERPEGGTLLLGLFDVRSFGAVTLRDVIVRSNSRVNTTLSLLGYPAAARPQIQPLVRRGAAVLIPHWSLKQAARPAGARGSADAGLRMHGAHDAPARERRLRGRRLKAAGPGGADAAAAAETGGGGGASGGGVACRSGDELQRLLQDPSVSRIALLGGPIALDGPAWRTGAGLSITRQVGEMACAGACAQRHPLALRA